MTSIVSICNKALDKLGHGPIISLGDGTKSANLCNRNWPLIRDQVLRDHPWNFAVRRKTLAAESTAPEWGFGAAFPLPDDCLRLVEVLDHTTGEYQVEGRKILCDSSILYIRYVSRVQDPNLYDPLFVDSVATRLAFEMCESLTQNNTKKDALFKEYDDSLTRAKRADGQENPPQVFPEDDWTTSRY